MTLSSTLRAVILAAGDGGRMADHTRDLPKPLVPLHGRPIIEYTLEALAEAGVSDALVVTGYRAAQVRDALSRFETGVRLSFASNPRFHLGASFSLRAARDFAASGPFLLLMADHILSTELVCRLASATSEYPAHCFVAADSSPREDAFSAEATKLQLDSSGLVTAIGKDLPVWDALDTGAFALTPAIWDATAAAPEDCELSVIMTELARRKMLYAADVSGASWYDIDTEADLAAAHDVVAGR